MAIAPQKAENRAQGIAPDMIDYTTLQVPITSKTSPSVQPCMFFYCGNNVVAVV